MLFHPRKPFSLAHTLRFILSPPPLLNGRRFAPLLDHWVEGEYRRVVEIAGQPVLYGVSEAGRALRARILAGPGDAENAAQIRALVERQFSLHLDLAPFYRLARRDRVLEPLARHFRGMRIPQAPSVFETVVSAILEQQVNLSFAHQVKLALIESLGTSVEFQGRNYLSFPLPAALAIATPRQLRRLQISGPKARYIIEIARATMDGSLDLEGLGALDIQAARERLLERPGVGPWTAQYVGLRALGHLDSLPAADVGLQKALARFYGLRKQPTAPRVERLARPWAGWRSYATFYLWMTYWQDEAWKRRLERDIRSRGAEEAKWKR
jgi:DNA-3-methyladenine glycosylase II